MPPAVAAVTDVAEFLAFRHAAEGLGLTRAGAVLQSPAGLAAGPSLLHAGATLWIDIREVIRTSYGFASALSFGDDVFESYVADGYLSHNPRTALGTDLRDALRTLAQAAGPMTGVPRLGVECGDGTALTLIEDLYRTGLRTFSVPASATAGMRLGLGQLAIKEKTS
jgi:pyruvate, orthophosphate dikinase